MIPFRFHLGGSALLLQINLTFLSGQALHANEGIRPGRQRLPYQPSLSCPFRQCHQQQVSLTLLLRFLPICSLLFHARGSPIYWLPWWRAAASSRWAGASSSWSFGSLMAATISSHLISSPFTVIFVDNILVISSFLSKGLFFACRDLVQAMQDGALEPEAALLNASLVRFPYLFPCQFFLFPNMEIIPYHGSFCEWKQVPDVFPVLAAAQKAFLAKSRDSLITRTLHSELVYNYSGSKHVRTHSLLLSIFVGSSCL